MHFIFSFILINLIIWPLWLWRYQIKPRIANKNLNNDFKKYPHYREIKKIERLLQKLYQNINGKSISRHERQRLKIHEDAFIYGEIEFLSFFKVLLKTQPQKNELFYDLGSGAGKAVFTVACYFNVARACGIEKLPRLHQTACDLLQHLPTVIKNHSTAPLPIAPVSFLNEDFLEADFSDGDIIFINATCLSYYLWEKLLGKLMHLKPGSRVIVTTKKIVHADFKPIDQSMELMSWGINSVNIYEKIA